MMKRRAERSTVRAFSMHRGWRRFAFAQAALALAFVAWSLLGVGGPAAQDLPEWPKGGHIRVLEAEPLPAEEAEAKYMSLLDKLVEDYRRSGELDVDYRTWKRVSRSPYLSDPHGQRYVNVYLNPAAEDFRHATKEKPLPAGARIAKDSFSVIHSGATSRGPLFLMEKMPVGFWPEAGDWRYTMIMPNGKLFGTSKGTGSAAVEFCAECHAKAAKRDFLFDLSDSVATPEP